MVTCFNQSIDKKESELGQRLLTQYPISVSKCVSNLYLGTLDNSVMEKKQGEMYFHFTVDLSAKWDINNELVYDYRSKFRIPKACSW